MRLSKSIPLIAVFAAAFLVRSPSARGQSAESARERISINAGWRFSKADFSPDDGAFGDPALKSAVLATRDGFLKGMSGAAGPVAPATSGPGASPAGVNPNGGAFAQPEFDDSGWRPLNLPHDWGVEGPFKAEYSGDTGRLPFWGTAWYRKRLEIPASDAGRRLFLDVDGAMSYATVWLNGHFVGGWPYGYASFELDLTPFANPGGDNVLAIRLDNPPNSSRWYPGGGIYRNVWLVKTAPIHVAHWGTYVTTPSVNAIEASVSLRVTVENLSPSPGTGGDPRPDRVSVKTDVFELSRSGHRAGDPVASSRETPVSVEKGGGRSELTQTIRLGHPMLWSTRSPYRYVAVTTITSNGTPVDVYETPFGVRTLAFDPEKGFLLNGERVAIQGVCDHSDLGSLGSAVNVRGLERQLEILQEMGCNAIRTSHNPPAPELLDLCDRMGFVVMDEAFDCWVRQKRPNDYHRLFADWHEADLRAQIRRDRNHPCVFMWSIGNEIPEIRNADGVRIGNELVRIVHEEDPTRPTTSACNSAEAGFNGFQDVLDAFGYNYLFSNYEKFHAAHPKKFLFGSETESTVSSRGAYAFPVVEDKSKGLTADFQVSSYDLYAPKWAWVPDLEFKAEDQHPYVAGEFVWTGWDYLGEPTPFGGKNDPSRSSYFGIIDLAGFKKDRFYEYQAHWRPDLPMAHLLPHWTWPDRVGQVTPVFVYTSGDEAELFLNGKSLGRKTKAPLEYRIRWNEVVYAPGELRVVAYKNGKKWAEDVQKTAGRAAKLAIQCDRTVVSDDGRDLAFVTVCVCDRNGIVVPDAGNLIHFGVSGPAGVASTDNGDATSFEPFQSSDRKAFHGWALAVVRTRAGETGPITIVADADGLEPAKIMVMSNMAE